MAFSAKHPRISRTHIWLSVPVLALAVLGACGRSGSGEPKAPPPAPTISPKAPPLGPARPQLASPGRFEPSEEEATSAAVAYVTNGQALLDLDPAEAEWAVRDNAAADTADAQVEELRERLAAVRRALAGGTGPIHYRQAALATRIEAFLPPRARVAVWHVAVLSRAGVAPPQAGWAVSVVDLLWEQGDWKLEHETVTAGPTPILDASAPPATAEQLESALDGFTPQDAQ